jgi:hypothetical protein
MRSKEESNTMKTNKMTGITIYISIITEYQWFQFSKNNRLIYWMRKQNSIIY